MTVTAIKCLKCNAIIYSRSTHDFHWCPCKSVAIDGGFTYIKITGNKEDWELTKLEILPDKTDVEVRQILYDDWNKSKNKYGVVK